MDEESKAYAYCMDSENNLVHEYYLCIGLVWDPYRRMSSHENSRGLLQGDNISTDSGRYIHKSFCEIMSVDSVGVAEVRYGYYTEPDQDSCVVDTIFLDPNVDREDILATQDERSTDTPIAEIAAEINTNPVHDVLTINILATSGSRYDIELYDVSGRQVLSESGILTQDRSAINMGVSHLPAGVYMTSIFTENHREVNKICIIR